MNFSPKIVLRAAGTLAAIVMSIVPGHAQTYKVTNLISDGSVPAAVTDPNFLNPWAISSSPNWWISAASSGFNYVIPSAGTISFKVIVPTSAAPNQLPGLPAGSVTTAGTVGFNLTNATKASFIFSTLDGTISGWNSKLGTNNAISTVMINNSSAGASYPGLAILNIGSNGVTSSSYLLAPNFGAGNKIEVYDSNFAPAALPGNFTDPNLPAGYSPFAVHVLGSRVFVTYAVRTATAPFRTVDAAGNGIVDAFDTNGNFVARIATRGNLNSPWGVAIAPTSFGIYSNDILIGNFGDGKINAFDPTSFTYQGQLMDSTGKSLTYPSLWELLPGGTTVSGATAVSAGDTSTVYFTAGLDKEAHGLFGAISNGVVTGATPTFGFTSSAANATVAAGGSVTTSLSIASANGFNSAVTLTCSGLPAGASCTFPSSTTNGSPSAPVLTSVTINTSKSSAALLMPGRVAGGVLAAFAMPLGLIFLARRRGVAGRRILPALFLGFAFTVSAVTLLGCGGYSNSPTTTVTPTPAGTSNVVVTATSGSISQTTTISLTVN